MAIKKQKRGKRTAPYKVTIERAGTIYARLGEFEASCGVGRS